MRIKPRRGSWILVLLFVIAWVSPINARVQAAVEPGLSATVYYNYGYNNAPPLPAVSGRPVQCTTTYLSINQNFGNNICGLYDDFIVKYEGYITSPTTGTYTLYMHGDDGVKLYLDDVLKVNAWYDSGNAGATTEISFVAGVPQKLLAWYYENGGGNWVKLEYLINGVYYPVPDSWFTQTNEPTNSTTTTTTLAPYFNEVQNLTAIANEDGSVNLAWDAPSASNTEIYGYSINFVDYDNSIERGGWGVWTLAANTSYSLGHWMFDGSNPVTTGYGQVRFKVYAMSGPCAGVGSGSCLYGPSTNADATVLDPTPTTTTTTSTTTTTLVSTTTTSTTTTTTSTTTTIVPEPETTTTTEPEPEITTTTISPTTTTVIETIFDPVDTPDNNSDPVTTPEVDPTPVTVPEEQAPTETIPEVVVPENTQDAADNAVADIFQNTDNADELGAAVTDAISNADSPEEVAALVTSLLDGPLSNEEFAAVVDSVFADDLSTEELSAALDAVFAEPLSDEKFAEVIDAVLDSPLTDEQFAEVVDILESDKVTEEQVAAAVDNILENGVTADQATELATSDKVLASIDGDQAAEIFAEIPVGELTQEEEAALVEAVTNAPEEVKNAFEETINVYGEGLDDYVPVGSSVDVGSRRTLLAASAALTAATAGMGGSGPTGGPGGGSGRGPGDGTNSNGRKEDEDPDGEEEDTEIEGPEDQEDNHFTRNSIFKYEEETMKRKFSPWGFIKKFSRETSALAFTISGSVVVFATLSGETRKITIIATGCAFLVHYIHAMIKNDED